MIPLEHFRFIPLDEVQSPQKHGPLNTYHDYWWAVTKDQQVVIYIGPSGRSNTPQCNLHRQLVERLIESYPFEAEARQLNWAYVQFKISDYV